MADIVGIIGYGLLGSAIGDRLEASGRQVLAFDPNPARKAHAHSEAEVLAQCHNVVLCLPDSHVVRAVIEGCQAALRPGSLLIDATTGDPDDSARLGAELAARGVEYLDATVGGSSDLVRQGRVVVTAGGTKEAFEAAAGLLATFAERIFHCGSWGSGARMKLVFNLVLGLNRAVLAEGLSFAEASGIDPATALEVLRAGVAFSRVMDTKGAKMLKGDYAPQARLSQHLKDVRLILQSGQRKGALLPLSEVHKELLERAETLGFGDADNSAVREAFRPK